MSVSRVQVFKARGVRGVRIENPTDAEDVSLGYAWTDVEIVGMAAWLLGSGGPSVTWTIKYAATRDAAGTAVVTAGTVTTTTTGAQVITTFNAASIPAGNVIWLETSAQGGTVTELFVSLRGIGLF